MGVGVRGAEGGAEGKGGFGLGGGVGVVVGVVVSRSGSGLDRGLGKDADETSEVVGRGWRARNLSAVWFAERERARFLRMGSCGEGGAECESEWDEAAVTAERGKE